ncbi:MAG: universal stress protein [Sphingomonadales bacterium]|nr:universal stress protein [Sphingomonadales bacterium]
MGTTGQQGRRRRIGGTTHDVILHAPGPVLLVPFEASPPPNRYQRILVPLDGSCWAESVLTIAARLARTAGAEIVLAHVVPRPELTEIHPPEAEDIALQGLLIERNERAARNYLEGIRSRLAAMGLRVRVLSERAEDVRTGLGALIGREHVDLVVLSARGQGSKRHGDLPYGSVSAYLMTHSAAPLLILQSGQANGDPAGAGLHEEVRLPRASLA